MRTGTKIRRSAGTREITVKRAGRRQRFKKERISGIKQEQEPLTGIMNRNKEDKKPRNRNKKRAVKSNYKQEKNRNRKRKGAIRRQRTQTKMD